MYRVDNTPDKKWRNVSTFPLHFHTKVYDHVEVVPFPINENDTLEIIFRKLLGFIRKKI